MVGMLISSWASSDEGYSSRPTHLRLVTRQRETSEQFARRNLAEARDDLTPAEVAEFERRIVIEITSVFDPEIGYRAAGALVGDIRQAAIINRVAEAALCAFNVQEERAGDMADLLLASEFDPYWDRAQGVTKALLQSLPFQDQRAQVRIAANAIHTHVAVLADFPFGGFECRRVADLLARTNLVGILTNVNGLWEQAVAVALQEADELCTRHAISRFPDLLREANEHRRSMRESARLLGETTEPETAQQIGLTILEGLCGIKKLAESGSHLIEEAQVTSADKARAESARRTRQLNRSGKGGGQANPSGGKGGKRKKK